jgi:hypothetical protein
MHRGVCSGVEISTRLQANQARRAEAKGARGREGGKAADAGQRRAAALTDCLVETLCYRPLIQHPPAVRAMAIGLQRRPGNGQMREPRKCSRAGHAPGAGPAPTC